MLLQADTQRDPMALRDRFTKQRMSEAMSCYPRAMREFFRNDGLDGAASLSYYMVLAMFPGLLALISLLSLVGASESSTQRMLDLLQQSLAASGQQTSDSQQLVETAEQLLTGLATSTQGTFWAILIGSLGALWSTSGYVTAFSRQMNRLYGVREGRPQWKRRPQMFAITVLIMIVAVISLALLVTSGSVAHGIGNIFGLGDSFVLILNLAKPPVLFVMILLVLALLYHFTPNVKRLKFRWFSPGTFTALIVLGLSAVGFAVYLSTFASYSATYGAIGGVIVLVLACWISNIALIIGALVDIEFTRLRQLRTGMASAEEVQLPLRDDTMVAREQLAVYKDLVRAQDIRISHGGDPLQDMEIDPFGRTKRKAKWLPIGIAASAAWLISRRRVVKNLQQPHDTLES